MTEEKEFVFEDWVRDGIRGMQRNTMLFPEDFRKHFKAAQKEALLAYRSLIDAAIERTEQAPKKRTHIKVE
jgi:hypothetical protein